jgi:hypothetical protein
LNFQQSVLYNGTDNIIINETPSEWSSILWDIIPCSPLKLNRRFGETCHLHLQCRRLNLERNQRETGAWKWNSPNNRHKNYKILQLQNKPPIPTSKSTSSFGKETGVHFPWCKATGARQKRGAMASQSEHGLDSGYRGIWVQFSAEAGSVLFRTEWSRLVLGPTHLYNQFVPKSFLTLE